MAVGALHALASAGLRAGRDVSVIGYDDLPIASYTDPPLTTLEQPMSAMAQRMVEMLLALLDGAAAAALGEVWRRADRTAVGRTGASADRRTTKGRKSMRASLAALSGVLVLGAFGGAASGARART